MTEINLAEPIPRTAADAVGERFEAEASGMADAYADTLMAELFEDVDRLLSDEPGALAVVAAEGDEGDESSAEMATAVIPVSTALDLPQVDGLAVMTDANREDRPQDRPTKRRRFAHPLVHLLLGAVSMSVLFTAGLWWVTSRQEPQGTALSETVEPVLSAAELQAQADAEFLTYLQRSLEVIEPPTAAAGAVANAPGTPVPGGLPTVPVPGSGLPGGTLPPLPGTAAAASGLPGAPAGNVIERIYVPVYQPPATAATPVPQSPPPVAATVTPAPSVGTVPALPPNVVPAVSHVLVGVLELGERSAALFEVDGVPQRIYVGQSIAASGWTLVSVTNQEAVIRRNGDVRSVFVGQQF